MDTEAESIAEIWIPMANLEDAMDCSLALTSQAIDHEIAQADADTQGYGLKVAAATGEHALQTVRRFREENRRWSWRRPLLQSRFAFHWASLVWCLLLGLFGYLPIRRPALIEGGILDSALVFGGEWWRIMTATMLHRDVAHLFSNLSVGFLLFGLVMGRFGAGLGLLLVALSGVGGNLFGLAFHVDPYRGLGASGAVMGALGLLAPHAMGVVRQHPAALRMVISGLLAVVMLFVLFGLSPESDVIAHFGGFVFGLAFGLVAGLFDPRVFRKGWVHFVSGGVLLGVLLICWGRALSLGF